MHRMQGRVLPDRARHDTVYLVCGWGVFVSDRSDISRSVSTLQSWQVFHCFNVHQFAAVFLLCARLLLGGWIKHLCAVCCRVIFISRRRD